MSNPPQDLLDIRQALHTITGSPLSDIGIAADPSHLSSGGYHCGAEDLRNINAVGNNDYSIRQARDRNQYNHDLPAGANWSSAMDYPDDWPNGGRAAWIRFNNLMRQQLGANDPGLSAIRGMNYTPDGTTKRRYDCLTDQESSSGDTVTWHTHIEWWRDTFNQVQRGWSLSRMSEIATAAVRNVPLSTITAPPPPTNFQEEQMILSCTNGSGTEKSVNNVSVPANGRVLVTPQGPWSLSGTNVGGFDTTFWKNTPQMTWQEIKDYCGTWAAPTLPVQVSVDATQVADAIVANPALGQLIYDKSFAASQDSENQ
jgi:hypothetical protein